MTTPTIGELAIVVRSEMNEIFGQRYTTTRRGGHHKDDDEHLTDRAFWPGVDFAPVEIEPDDQMVFTFRTTDSPDRTFGYRFDLAVAVERWNHRIGIVDAMSRPVLFASELCWYLVAHIGSLDLDRIEQDDEGIYWVDARTTMFGRLR